MQDLFQLGIDNLKTASVTCAEAFKDDPFTLYTIPDVAKRPNLRYACEYSLRMAFFNRAEMYATSPECEAIAVWRDSLEKESATAFLRVNPLLRLSCGWSYVFRDEQIDRFVEKAKKKIAPRHHLYLGLLAVHPCCQGKGYAGALLRAFVAEMKRRQLPGYLETQNLKNTRMYEHFGFRTVEHLRIPRSDVELYLMLQD